MAAAARAAAFKTFKRPREGESAAVKHYAHNLRTPKHGSRYRYGRRRGRHTTCYYTGRESAAVLGGEAQPPPLD